MRTATRISASGAVLCLGLMFLANGVSAKPEYTRRTKQGCDVCHPPDSRGLNEGGVYYRKHHSLDGFKPPEQPKSDSTKGEQPKGQPQSATSNSNKKK